MASNNFRATPLNPTSQLDKPIEQSASSYCPPPTPNPPSTHRSGEAPCPLQSHNQNKINQGNAQPPAAERNSNHTRNMTNRSFCSREFQGKGKCEKKDGCAERHDIDFRKLRRGLCFNEFFKKGSCRNREQCQYCHQIPDSVRSDPEIMKNIDEKIQKSYEKKAEREKTGNVKTSNNTITNQDTSNSGSEENIPKTRTNQVPPSSEQENRMLSQNNLLSESEQYKDKWIPHQQNPPMDQMRQTNVNVVYDNTTYLPNQEPTNSNLMYSYWPPLTPENKSGTIASAGVPYLQNPTNTHFLSQAPQQFAVPWHHQQSQPLQRRM